MKTFREELQELIQKHRMAEESNVSDLLLADYLVDCFWLYSTHIKARDEWTVNKPEKISLTGVAPCCYDLARKGKHELE